jgi:hypothetical protein
MVAYERMVWLPQRKEEIMDSVSMQGKQSCITNYCVLRAVAGCFLNARSVASSIHKYSFVAPLLRKLIT